VPVLFHTGSALGIHPSELSPPERYPGHYHPDAPTYRFAYRCSRRGKRWAGPNRLRFLGFDPFESPLQAGKGLVRRPLDAPMGFGLAGFAIGSLARAFAQTPLTRFASLTIAHQARRRPRVSVSFRPASSDE
jgi:hypothetical protein